MEAPPTSCSPVWPPVTKHSFRICCIQLPRHQMHERAGTRFCASLGGAGVRFANRWACKRLHRCAWTAFDFQRATNAAWGAGFSQLRCYS